MAIYPYDLDDFTNEQLRFLNTVWRNDEDESLFEAVREEMNIRYQTVYRRLNPIQSVVRKRIVNRVDTLKPKRRANGGVLKFVNDVLSADLPGLKASDYMLRDHTYHDAIDYQTIQRHIGKRATCVWCSPEYKNMD